jgi:urease accessory protein
LRNPMSAFLRASSFRRVGEYSGTPFDRVLLDHAGRHLRRRMLTCVHDDRVLVDLPEPARLRSGDVLVLDDGRLVEVISSEEKLLEVRGSDARHLARLAWHIGNRHLAAQIEPTRILIQQDHVIAHMLEGLGACLAEVSEPFDPEAGAYASGGGHGHPHE